MPQVGQPPNSNQSNFLTAEEHRSQSCISKAPSQFDTNNYNEVPERKEDNAESEFPVFIGDAVGTIIADRPPHRSVRALLRIRLPPWMSGEEASYRIRMQNAWSWKPPSEEREELIPPRRSLTAAA